MDDLLWARVAVTFLVDASLSLLCGCLLAGQWLCREKGAGWRWASGRLRVFSAVLAVASGIQIVLLSMNFSGQMNPRALWATLPDIFATHTGGVLLAQSAVAALLLVATWISGERMRETAGWVMVLCCLALHGSTGHAAVDDVVSWTEALQWVHLLGMALWSGGVMVSGFAVLPGLRLRAVEGSTGSASIRSYLGKLSAVSTWSVAAVLLSGAAKSLRTTGGSVAPIWTSRWGHILIVKAIFVTAALLLGARNRWLLAVPGLWSASTERKATRTLLVESICMTAVLALSAWLANTAPPLE